MNVAARLPAKRLSQAAGSAAAAVATIRKVMNQPRAVLLTLHQQGFGYWQCSSSCSCTAASVTDVDATCTAVGGMDIIPKDMATSSQRSACAWQECCCAWLLLTSLAALLAGNGNGLDCFRSKWQFHKQHSSCRGLLNFLNHNQQLLWTQ